MYYVSCVIYVQMFVKLCVLLAAAKYKVGTPAPDACGQTVNSITDGVLLSPTYPGMYPDHIFCFYKIHGSAGQRVQLTFTDIDLYAGGTQSVILSLFFIYLFIYLFTYLFKYLFISFVSRSTIVPQRQ